jgi:hypothetical protein
MHSTPPPPPPSPVLNVVNVSSETEPGSECSYVDDGESEEIIANQAGLHEFQHHVIESSPPPPVGDGVNDKTSNMSSNDNASYNNGEFFRGEKCGETDFSVSQRGLQRSSQC